MPFSSAKIHARLTAVVLAPTPPRAPTTMILCTSSGEICGFGAASTLASSLRDKAAAKAFSVTGFTR